MVEEVKRGLETKAEQGTSIEPQTKEDLTQNQGGVGGDGEHQGGASIDDHQGGAEYPRRS